MMSRKRIIITGISGLLGNNLAYCLKDRYDIAGWYHNHPCVVDGIVVREVDLSNDQLVRHWIHEFQPEAIIHCAAISDIEQCEKDKKLAYAVNVAGTRALVNALDELSCQFVYISTDSIYLGSRQGTRNHEESDVEPSNHYAWTKIEAEQEALKRKNSVVLRTNFFGWNVQEKFSLGEWITNELAHNRKIKGFKDVEFSSIYTFELAHLVDLIIEKNLQGTYNAASRNYLSKYEFALKMAQRFGLNEHLIEPISVDDFTFKAKRRKYLALDVSKLEKDLNCICPTIEESIDRFYQDFQKGVPVVIKDNQPRTAYPQLDFIPYGRQTIEDDDIKAVVDVLKSSHLTQGPKIVEFEDLMKQKTNARFAVAVNSGTSALHIACLAADIQPGDEVITSPISFVASANCAVYCGATPVFADIDRKTYNISAQTIAEKITPKTKAVIAVHFAGQSCDMRTIKELVRKKEQQYQRKIYIIEDASHALGSMYQEFKVGSCAYSDMTVMSFHPVKHITTAEGGMVLVNDEHLCRLLRRFRSHGITNETSDFVHQEEIWDVSEKGIGEAVRKPWYYEQQYLGFNYRITDIQCALGISQLKKLDRFARRRREIVDQYNRAFKEMDHVVIPSEDSQCASNFHLYVLLFDFEKLGISRTRLMLDWRQQGIQTQVHYIPIYTQPFYQKNFGYQWGECPNAEEYYQQCLSLPLFAGMKDEEVRKVIETVQRIPIKQ